MVKNIIPDNIYLFMYTMREYKRFSFTSAEHALTDDYDEVAYAEINIKLMLLRKYGNNRENVFVEKVIISALEVFPEKDEVLTDILKKYNEVINLQIEQILPDGTKLSLYRTIEDVMYGLFLHADKDKIHRLRETDEKLRFTCVRKYVEDLEKVLFMLYACLSDYNELFFEEIKKDRATVVYLGDKDENNQQMINVPYWTNLYGHDADEKELAKIKSEWNADEIEIQLKCTIFLEELKKEKISYEIMDKLIFSTTKKDWGNFLEAREFYLTIPDPGISSKVRFNDEHTMAYVRIHPNVTGAFVIQTPHIITDVYEIALVKRNGFEDWRIYSLGGHLDSYIIKNKT